jgi:hypothetical protein
MQFLNVKPMNNEQELKREIKARIQRTFAHIRRFEAHQTQCAFCGVPPYKLCRIGEVILMELDNEQATKGTSNLAGHSNKVAVIES